MLNIEIGRWVSTFVVDPDAPLSEARHAIATAVAQARTALGPNARPCVFYQVGENPITVAVTFQGSATPPAPGEVEAFIFDRIVIPSALPKPLPGPRGALTLSAAGAGADDGWIRLASGGRFYPLRPEPAAITLYDIASGLSRECRYNGQLERLEFYSVAEHCVHLSRAVPAELAAWALLHDAAEGLGIRDLPRPIKPAMGRTYADAEDAVLRAVAVRFGLPWPAPATLKHYDTRVLQNERAAIWSEPQTWVTDAEGPPLEGVEIHGWLPHEARTQFLRRADELGIRELPITEGL